MSETIRYRLKTFHVAEAHASEGPPIGDASYAATLARYAFRDLDQDVEHFAVLSLDAKNRARGYKVIAQGTATACLVHPREVFRAALSLGAVTLIVVHNHPSGDPTPSQEDITLTARLVEAGQILGIPVVDHLILGSGSAYVSLRDRGSM